jgi:hypothetical protein
MRMPEPQVQCVPVSTIQRQAEDERVEEPDQVEVGEEVLQAKVLPGQTEKGALGKQRPFEGLRSQGQPLADENRKFFETRFGADFSGVRVHTDSRAGESAAALHAKAFTVGREIVFGSGQYQPTTEDGRRLLAHELTHVVQQAGMNRPDGRQAGLIQRQAEGANAPVARLNPQKIPLRRLKHELEIIERAAAVLRKLAVDAMRHTHGSGTFSRDSLFDSLRGNKRFKWLKNPADLDPAIERLIADGIITTDEQPAGERDVRSASYGFLLDRSGQVDGLDSLLAEGVRLRKEIALLEERIQVGDPLKPVYQTGQIPIELSSDARQVKQEKAAEMRLRRLQEQYGEMPGSLGRAMQEEIRAAEKDLEQKKRYRTFALSVAEFMTELQRAYPGFSGGNYRGHSWGEFSADLYLRASKNYYEWIPSLREPELSASAIQGRQREERTLHRYSGKYYARDAVKQFFEALNALAVQGLPKYGKFSWRAIYNDMPLARELNARYGGGHVLQADNHGPQGNKLHIHLDICPVDAGVNPLAPPFAAGAAGQ